MTAIVFYFQVHQPYRLLPQTSFELAESGRYFDDGLNREIIARVAQRCYLPMNAVLREAFEKTDGRFRFAFALSGTALSQLEDWAPEALDSFVDLAQSGAAEIVCETAYHSLASIVDVPGCEDEFELQVLEHRSRLEQLFGSLPRTFRNTELVFDNDIARRVEDMGFDVLLGEGADRLLDWRSPRYVYRPRGCTRLKLLLRDYLFSDDIAFRFSNREWPQYPLMADTFVDWLARAEEDHAFIGLFMDYETFGEHQGSETGILEFMSHVPELALERPNLSFQTPGELAAAHEPVAELDAPDPISWADEQRDLSAWLANPMQRETHRALYALAPRMREAEAAGHPELIADWRKLTTSDHVYYMYALQHEDGNVHEYFTPYDSPHQSFVLVMNAIDDLRARAEKMLG